MARKPHSDRKPICVKATYLGSAILSADRGFLVADVIFQVRWLTWEVRAVVPAPFPVLSQNLQRRLVESGFERLKQKPKFARRLANLRLECDYFF